jgi:hypothetical protein
MGINIDILLKLVWYISSHGVCCKFLIHQLSGRIEEKMRLTVPQKCELPVFQIRGRNDGRRSVVEICIICFVSLMLWIRHFAFQAFQGLFSSM